MEFLECNYKLCPNCLNMLPSNNEYFAKDSSKKDGLFTYCKECWKELRSDIKNNRDLANKYTNTYRNKHKEKLKLYSKNKYKKLKQNATLTKEEWNRCNHFFRYSCAYCGKKAPLTHDHFLALSKGGLYIKDNILPACISCNCSKHNESFFTWYPRQKFYSEVRERMILKYLEYPEWLL